LRKCFGGLFANCNHYMAPEATLQGDLGAESLDFLDILFRLEREFGIRIPQAELFPEAIFKGDPKFVQDGKVTDQGLDELRQRLPFADLRVLEQNRLLTSIPDLFTVGLITRYIAWKLDDSAVSRSRETA
jgi:acyl carrier protein